MRETVKAIQKKLECIVPLVLKLGSKAETYGAVRQVSQGDLSIQILRIL